MSPALKDAHRELAGRVMGRAGVSGTAIGKKGGKPCLKVYVSDSSAANKVPKSVGGFRVVVEKTGAFRKL